MPDFIIISENKIRMSDFLMLSSKALKNLNGKLFQSIMLENFSAAANPYESITGGNLLYTDYLSLINDVISFMDANRTAPNFKNTIRGAISYQSLIYINAQLLVSANKNNILPEYITLVPWSIVQNTSTTFISMDLINSMAFYLKNYVITNHALPNNLNILGFIINMPQFLMLEIVSLKNIKIGLYQSIILRNYSAPNNPSESLIAGKISFANYFNAIDNIKSYMDTNAQAPNYSWISQGNMSYYNLIFMYAIILDYYNTRGSLPEYVSVNPWSVVSNPNTMSFTETQIMEAAETVEYYIEVNHVLPDKVVIGGYNVTMPQFLKLLTTTLHNLNGTYAGQILLGNFGYPTSYSETTTGGILDQDTYLNLARSVEYFMFDGRAPNYQSSTIGNIRYDSLIYMFSQILSSTKQIGKLPDFIVVDPWSKISNSSNTFVSVGNVVLFSSVVKYFIEKRHVLPINVTIFNFTISMPQYLKLLSNCLNYINGNLRSNILLENYSVPIGVSEKINSSLFDEEFYMSLSNNVSSYIMDNGNVPAYMVTNLGNISYQSLIYTFSSILSYYFDTNNLPDVFYFNNWSVISSNNTKFVSINDILAAGKSVADYIEKYHTLPSSVVVNGSTITMAQFLSLAVIGVMNIDNGFSGMIPIKNYGSPTNISEGINQSFGISNNDLIDLASVIAEYMEVNGKAPDYQNSTLGKVGFNSLIYTYSQILRSYQVINQTPSFITIVPWDLISNSSTVFISMEQLKNASTYIQSYVSSYHVLPSSVLVSGVNISMDEFLLLSAKSVTFLKSDLDTSLILERLNTHISNNASENIMKGDIYYDEILEIADYVVSYSNTNKKVPSNFNNSSLGDLIGFESLVFMFSNIMATYNVTNGNISDQLSVVPWLAVYNPNKTYNFRSNKVFDNLQEAINDVDTIVGDTLWLSKDKYLENIILNKKLTITSLFDNFVLIQALNTSTPVFTINSNASGSLLKGLWINGSSNYVLSWGVYISNSSNNTILECKITGHFYGIEIYESSGNVISTNIISDNLRRGISVESSLNDEIAYNNVTNNMYGIFSHLSNNSKFYDNIVSENWIGFVFENSSGEGHYNIIFKNTESGLYVEGINSVVNFINNWWGSNNPISSSNNGSDIHIKNGNVLYNPYLILKLTTSTDRSTWNSTHYEYFIEADLTYNNNGEDTSPHGNIPDDLIIYFNSTNGYINASTSTVNGKAKVKLINTTNGTTTVFASFNDFALNKTFNVMSVNSTGVLNTRTGEYFETIQEAINSINTKSGDLIRVSEGTYYENIIINKKITLEVVSGEKVYLCPKDIDQNMITITSSGSGSTISGFNIIGSGYAYGISLVKSYGCIIKNNIISGFNVNIYSYISGNNTIQNNTILDGVEGISLIASNNNKINGNKLVSNENGINLQNSNYNAINSNELTYNYYAIYISFSDNINILNNKVINNWVGVYLFKTDSNNIIGNNFTENGAGLSIYNSIATLNSSNIFKNNWLADTSVIDDSEMVMATTVYTCGPAALATLFKKWGIFTTEAELAKLADTDNEGTSLWGLKNASESKGIYTNAYNVTSDKLKVDNIVLLKINGFNHFELILNMTNETITLFDPNLGIISMNWTKFNELFTGIVMVFNDTITNCTPLSEKMMKEIKGLWHYEWRTYYKYHPPKIYWKTYTIKYPVKISVKVGWKTGWFGIKYPVFSTKIVWKSYTVRVPYVKNAGWFQAIKYRVKVYDWKDVVNVGKFVYKKVSNYVNNGIKSATSIAISVINNNPLIKSTAKNIVAWTNSTIKAVNSLVTGIDKGIKSLENGNNGNNKFVMRTSADVIGGFLMTGAIVAASTGVGAPVAAVMAVAGIGLMAYGNGMFEDPLNPVNAIGFSSSVAFSIMGGNAMIALKGVLRGAMGASRGATKNIAKSIVYSTYGTIDAGESVAYGVTMSGFEKYFSN
ncbi:MAG: right-handed parallel beta-helix repeat-containing protein [Methanobrevibacter arboriphilus]|uniref:Right-handed parallel beta-helix repeat-containing protein n=2 Tax=Methanobrevibacter arboriphilus TaxID=39441 RepID=A0A843AD45_METAZ|nr:right-handed parallel beta-helix repeat-containing protein [Methanobrevibacter arboriphilus]